MWALRAYLCVGTRCTPAPNEVWLVRQQESPTCAPDRPSKILLVQVGTLSSSPIPRLGLSVFFLSFSKRTIFVLLPPLVWCARFIYLFIRSRPARRETLRRTSSGDHGANLPARAELSLGTERGVVFCKVRPRPSPQGPRHPRSSFVFTALSHDFIRHSLIGAKKKEITLSRRAPRLPVNRVGLALRELTERPNEIS